MRGVDVVGGGLMRVIGDMARGVYDGGASTCGLSALAAAASVALLDSVMISKLTLLVQAREVRMFLINV